MSVDSLLVLLVVTAAALSVGLRLFRTLALARRRSKPGCGGDCGCGHP